jgi:hypothetical protein
MSLPRHYDVRSPFVGGAVRTPNYSPIIPSYRQSLIASLLPCLKDLKTSVPCTKCVSETRSPCEGVVAQKVTETINEWKVRSACDNEAVITLQVVLSEQQQVTHRNKAS